MNSVESMQAILGKLDEILCNDRNETHGDPYDQFEMTAALWSIVFKYNFTRADVALAMQLSKISRERHGTANPDDDYDNLGYGVIKLMSKMREEQERNTAEEIAKLSLGSERFMTCRLCEHIQPIRYGERFKCAHCDGRYGKLNP